MAIHRMAAVAGALVIEAFLIVSVVLSSIGVAPGAQPTPGGSIPVPTTTYGDPQQ